MPTPEEIGNSKPRRGACEKCNGPRGVRRTTPDGQFVLCAECAREMGIGPSAGRPGRHKHGGAPGKVRP